MSIASALGFGRKVRYGFVALGDIAQEAMLPGVAHTGNSEVTALVSGDPEKLRAVGRRYGVKHCYGYEQFGDMLRSGEVDAIYLATPNWDHADYAIAALDAGVHVLVEKPLEITSDKCRAILAAQARSAAKLMVAYRLHFEPATLDTIARIRRGEIGDPLIFSSAFGQPVDPENHRAHHGWQAGPLLDMGPYPVNAARYLFEAEPIEVVSAVATRYPHAGLPVDLDSTVAVTLRFPGDRLAQFTVSYVTDRVDSFTVAGTKGSIRLDPAYGFGGEVEQLVTRGGEAERHGFGGTDQFGGELRYFSDCVLEDREPEPDAEEGLADLLVLEAVLRALESGAPQRIEPLHRTRRIDPAQVQRLRPVTPPEPVNAAAPTRQEA